jgi:nucleoside-diphosphate-sugar epimerase
MGKNLITGGCGFIGRHLARYLAEANEQVVIFDIKEESVLNNALAGHINYIKGDLTDWEQVCQAVSNNGIDCIYHLGGVLLHAAETSPQLACQINVSGTLNILEAARLFNVGSVIFASTAGATGSEGLRDADDTAVYMPNTMYGLTKFLGERLGEYYYSRYNVNFRSIRLPAVMGPREKSDSISRYVSLMIQEPALGYAYQVYVDKSIKNPYLYIKDIVHALVKLKNADEARLKRRVYNLAGLEITAGEEADIVGKYLPEARIDFKPDEVSVNILKKVPFVDGSKAREEWGFHPIFATEEAVRDFINEVQSNKQMYTHQSSD